MYICRELIIFPISLPKIVIVIMKIVIDVMYICSKVIELSKHSGV